MNARVRARSTTGTETPPDVRGGAWRYVHILGICWRAAVSQQLEYRADLVAKAMMSGFWLVWAALGVSVYFRFAGSVAGWSYPEVLVVVGLFFTVNGLRQAFLDPNLDSMAEYIRRGTLDHVLLQPVDSQLLVSFRKIGMANLADPLLGLLLAGVGLSRSAHTPGPGDVASFLLVLTAALALLYALVLGLMCLAVLLPGADDLGHVSFAVVELARFPVQAYRQPLQAILVVIPVAFLTTLPAQALLGRLSPVLLIVAPGAAALAVAAASVGWHRLLRRYTGASS